MRAILTNGIDTTFQCTKIAYIPISGIYGNKYGNYNSNSYLFVLTYGVSDFSYLFDVKQDGEMSVAVNEYHFDNSEKPHIYYDVDANGITIYALALPYRSGYVNCLNDTNVGCVRYFSKSEILTSLSAIPANVVKQKYNITGARLAYSKIEKCELSNLVSKSIGIYADNQTWTIDLSKVLGNERLNGYIKIVNYDKINSTTKIYEVIATTGVLTVLNEANLYINYNDDTKALTFPVAQGWCTFFMQPIFVGAMNYD